MPHVGTASPRPHVLTAARVLHRSSGGRYRAGIGTTRLPQLIVGAATYRRTMTGSPSTARTARSDVRRSIDDLVTDAQRYRHSADFRELLEFMARFRRQKPFNALLLHAQRPGARFVAPAHRWREKYERQVRPGETPLVALQPFGPVMFVYDVSQTEPMGDQAIPDRFANAFAMPPITGVEKALPRLVENAKVDGVRVSHGTAGASHAGRISEVIEGRTQDVVVDRRLLTTVPVPVRYELVVNRDHSPTEQLATVAHELGHLYCGHLGTPDPTWWPDRRRTSLNEREFEAETVAYLVCQRVDEHAKLPPYLDGFLEHHDTVPQGISLDVITKAAGMVIELLDSWAKPRKSGREVATVHGHRRHDVVGAQ